jgi:hypothetical protein
MTVQHGMPSDNRMAVIMPSGKELPIGSDHGRIIVFWDRPLTRGQGRQIARRLRFISALETRRAAERHNVDSAAILYSAAVEMHLADCAASSAFSGHWRLGVNRRRSQVHKRRGLRNLAAARTSPRSMSPALSRGRLIEFSASAP